LYEFHLATGAVLSMASLGVSIQELVSDADTPPTPAPQDFDGDGKTDPTVFRPSTGTWYQFRSSGTSSGA
jgi:hypothetical protein